MLENAKGELPVTADEFDTNPWLLNVTNGVLDLCTGSLREHRPEDMITKLAPVPYEPQAQCPTWLGFLDRVLGGNQDLVDFVQRMVGYTLTGSTKEQCLFFLYGTGRNGKSTFLETIRELLGDYARNMDFTSILKTKHDRGPRGYRSSRRCPLRVLGRGGTRPLPLRGCRQAAHRR